MRPTVYLFDIDGTLVSTGGAGRKAMQRAFHASYGRPDACDFKYGGMTDPAIARRGIEAVGRVADAASIAEVLALYVAALGEEILRAEGFVVHEGVVEALDRAALQERAAIGVGTGNVVEGARVKLSHAKLHHRFGFGGYGSDHEDRPTLIRMGSERGAQALGVAVVECRVVVIGDTPRDIEAARAIGAECVAVATGGYTMAELHAHAADVVVPSLAHPEAFRALFPA